MEKHYKCTQKNLDDLASFMNERWHGMFPVCWGETLVEVQFTSWLYKGVLGIDREPERHEENLFNNVAARETCKNMKP